MVTRFSSRGAGVALALVIALVSHPVSAQKPLPPARGEPIARPLIPKSTDSVPPKSSAGVAAPKHPSSADPAPTPAADPGGGHYRVVLNGFTANRQTYDHPLQIDGKGDEVYFSAYVARFDTTSPNLVDHEVITSKVHGDVNGFPERKQVGLASGRGGIKSGDTYPFPAPFKRVGDVSRDELPMLLWEGELSQGSSAVVIVPTVWEWDDNPELYAYWVVGRGAFIERLLEPAPLLSILGNRSWLPVELAAPGLRVPTDGIGDARDRPIGLDAGNPATDAAFAKAVANDRTPVPLAPAGGLSLAVQTILGLAHNSFTAKYESVFRKALEAKGTSGNGVAGSVSLPKPEGAGQALEKLNGSMKSGARFRGFSSLLASVTSAVRQYGPQELYFFEKAIILTPASIEDALRNASTAGGRPAGVIDVSYIDTNRLAGRYTLHIQVERLP